MAESKVAFNGHDPLSPPTRQAVPPLAPPLDRGVRPVVALGVVLVAVGLWWLRRRFANR